MSQRSSNMDLHQSIADWHIESHRSERRYHPAPRISPSMPAWRMNHDSDVSLRSAAVLGDGHVTAWHPSKRCSSARCGRLRMTILPPGSAPNIDARGSRRRCRTNEVTGLGCLTSRQQLPRRRAASRDPVRVCCQSARQPRVFFDGGSCISVQWRCTARLPNTETRSNSFPFMARMPLALGHRPYPQIPTLPSDFSTLTTTAFPPIERQGTRRRGDRQRRHQAAASRRT
jgi:hypothetical protein